MCWSKKRKRKNLRFSVEGTCRQAAAFVVVQHLTGGAALLRQHRPIVIVKPSRPACGKKHRQAKEPVRALMSEDEGTGLRQTTKRQKSVS